MSSPLLASHFARSRRNEGRGSGGTTLQCSIGGEHMKEPSAHGSHWVGMQLTLAAILSLACVKLTN